MNDSMKIAFIGAGHMATALARGLQGARRGAIWSIAAADPDAGQRDRFAAAVAGASTTRDPEAAIAGADIIVWAVKPQVLREVASAHRSTPSGALHLSIAAGIRLQDVSAWLASARVVRAMPNTPALVGAGMCGLLAGDAVSSADRALIENVLAPTGDFFWVESDAMMDAVTAVSGSGPAYVFHFMEGLAEAAALLGFDPVQSRRLALATVQGAARLAERESVDFGVLRERVTSQGGTTAAALDVLDARATQEALASATRAALERAREIGKAFSQPG